ncbi:murein biosynthesis integral membrane protein MurJ [Xylanimonas allomyrinae]|uniref:murein biosynthesis integral membrane protein MurJ n=1 Tax=Xylanimonas allomyrinae TaxID=2509459 RepID=UPI001FECB11E|nr:lipid II flippase MurJ [Xylanimonas allomyrinae]
MRRPVAAGSRVGYPVLTGPTDPTELLPIVEFAPGDAPASQPSGAAAGTGADLGRNTLILTIGTFLSRASGQVRAMLLVGAIGISGTVANAFDVANTLPNMLFALLAAGVLQAVLMPQIMRALQADDGKQRLDKLLTISLAALVGVTALLVAATPLLIRLFTLAGDWSPQARALAVTFGFWCIPQVLFYGLFSILSETLNARGQFAASGLAPIANNVISVIGFGAFIILYGGADGPLDDLTLWSTRQTVLLAGTATLGIIAQSAVLLVALRRGGYHWHLRWGLHGIGLRSASRVVGWTLGAVVLEQIGLIYLRNVTGAAGQAAAGEAVATAGNAVFTNALTIYLLPHSLVILSIMQALFPRMSRSAAAGDLDDVRDAMSTGLRSAGIFSVISTALFVVLAEPGMKALLPTLQPSAVELSAPVLRALAFGLVALGATAMIKRMYFAFEDGRGIFVIQIVATIALSGVLWLAVQTLDSRYWAVAAAAGYSLSAWVSVLLRAGGMSKKLGGIDGPRIVRLHLRAIIAALLASGAGYWVTRLIGGYGDLTWLRAVTTCVLAGGTMLGVYFAGLRLMRVRELDAALKPLLRRLGRR